MNKQVLHTAVVLALGSLASPAFAYDPFALPALEDYSVQFSGATASSNTVRTYIIDKICDKALDPDIRVYRRGAGPAFGNDWAIACTTRAGLDINGDGDTLDVGEALNVSATSRQVLFRKRDTGGSGWGVTPVTGKGPLIPADQIVPITTMAINSTNCPGGAIVPAGEMTPAGTLFFRYSCGATEETGVHADAGFSDIEPSKFLGINTPAGLSPYSGNGSTTPRAFGGLVFNTPVTKDLRDALQRVQFDRLTNDCNPLHAGYNAPVPAPTNYLGGTTVIKGESEACMPSLTTTEIRSLFTGNVPTWNNFLVTQNPPGLTKVALALHNDVLAAPAIVPVDKKVQICRRVNGSGTQAQFNAIFTNYPCDLTVRTASIEPGSPAGPVVASNSGSSDVSKCLNDFHGAPIPSTAGLNASGKNVGLVKRWAIGVQSTENNVDLAFNYRFIRVNGYAPTLQSVVAGDYEDYAEQSFQYRTADVVGGADSVTPIDKQVIFKYIEAQGSTIDDTAAIDLAYVHSWGQGGWLVAPKTPDATVGTVFTPANPFSLTKPVNSSTRAPNNAVLNICNFPTTIKNVEIDTGFSTGKH